MNYHSKTQDRTINSLIFIDAETMVASNSLTTSATELIVIDPDRDGISQITSELAQRCNVHRLQIISAVDSNAGSLKIGSTQLNVDTIESYTNDLLTWRDALSNSSEIILYGCCVIVESLFQNFIHQFSKITQADIGAFVTLTGDMAIQDELEKDSSLIVAWR